MAQQLAASDLASSGAKAALFAGQTGAGDGGEGGELPALHSKLHGWSVEHHQFLAAFAATKFTKNGQGALFVFANCGLDDLLVAEDEPGFTEARKLERQIVLVWGGATEKAEGDCTLAKLRAKVVDKTAGLERSIAEGCTREAFPVVICAGMEFATVGQILHPGIRV